MRPRREYIPSVYDIAKSMVTSRSTPLDVRMGNAGASPRQIKWRYVMALNLCQKLPPRLVGIEPLCLGASLVAPTASAWPHRCA